MGHNISKGVRPSKLVTLKLSKGGLILQDMPEVFVKQLLNG